MKTYPRIIESRLEELTSLRENQRINALKQVVQELSLFALYRSGAFKDMAFMGGTALRIIHGIRRFSEDIDLELRSASRSYKLSKIIDAILIELKAWGLEVEVKSKSEATGSVQNIWIKESSLGSVLILDSPMQEGQKIHVKLELDINPGAGAKYEQHQLSFPISYSITYHDMSTLFAGKLAAIIERSYQKGRDWYDLDFYLSKKISPNLEYLKNNLGRGGNKKITVPEVLTVDWLIGKLKVRVSEFNLAELRREMLIFAEDARDTQSWSKEYFINKIGALRSDF